jgi:hypothetical protein
MLFLLFRVNSQTTFAGGRMKLNEKPSSEMFNDILRLFLLYFANNFGSIYETFDVHMAVLFFAQIFKFVFRTHAFMSRIICLSLGKWESGKRKPDKQLISSGG